MKKNDGFCKCDYCGDEFGEFDNATGNHTSCTEITKLREALTQANELHNAVEAMNLELTERITQDELAFGFMREANTLLTADVKRLTAELAQCKHALDDEVEDLNEMCKCGHYLGNHRLGECIEQQSDGYICECNNFEVAK